MIIADTSGLLAYFNVDEPRHTRVRQALAATDAPIIVSPFVIAELDYLVATRLGVPAELAVLSELSGGAYDLVQLTAGELRACGDVIDRYRDQDIGVTDASLVVLAHRFDTTRILTLDRRHFDVLRSIDGAPFDILD